MGILNAAKTNDKICDVGCGGLSLLRQLKSRGYKNLYGFDIDSELINVLPEDSFSEIKIGSASDVPFEDNFFDVVFFDVVTVHSVFHHIDDKDWETVFNEIDRILKVKGKLFILEPYPYALWRIWSVISWFLSLFGSSYFKSWHELISNEHDLMGALVVNMVCLRKNCTESLLGFPQNGFWGIGSLKELAVVDNL